MKTIILAAATALTLSTGVALAGDGDTQPSDQPFVRWAGLNNPPVVGNAAVAQNGSAIRTYVTQSHAAGQFHDPNQGANS